ncbi:hypothetical protein C0992_006020 [Termitomyces sp. T32_za158]|nr:hypothetical protein C0992_006020 [Termitomyces sp. T32_za158]
MTNFDDIFLRNHRRRQELYEKTDALQEERFQKADAAREIHFVQGQQDRARVFELEQTMRGKRVEWYSTIRKGLFSDDRQRLAEKYNALNAALVEQFDRVMERQEEMGEVAKERSNHQDTPIPVPPDGSLGPSNSPSFISLIRIPPPHENILAESNGRVILVPPSPSPSISSSFWDDESLNSLTEPTSPGSNEKQKQEENIESDGVEGDKLPLYFRCSQKQRQQTFLQDESGRDRRFCASESARNTVEWERSTIFDHKMTQWSTKSQIEQIRGREEERFKSEIRRSVAFQNAEYQHWTVFEMSMTDIMDQAYAEEDLEEIHFKRQEDMLLALYERQANQLNQRTEDQIISFKFMRDRNRFSWAQAARAIFKGPFIHKALPTPKVTNMPKRKMQEMFESSQGLRAEAFQKGAEKREYTFAINEAKREAEFVKVQQKRKELFHEAEDTRDSEFRKAQQQRESEFQANEGKREDDFQKKEVERNDRAREEREKRTQEFQSTMSRLQQQFIDADEERLKELELLGEALFTSREQGQSLNLRKIPHRSFRRLAPPRARRIFI